MTGARNQGAQHSIRLHLIVGLAIALVLAGGLGGWASTAEISGALIAPGSIVVESNVKKVQHPTGGVVGEVRARHMFGDDGEADQDDRTGQRGEADHDVEREADRQIEWQPGQIEQRARSHAGKERANVVQIA
jgi:hypothetical protein